MIPKYKFTFLLLAALPLFCFAQENSPYSRYGVGNIVPSSNIANRAMGGISAAGLDGITNSTTINTVNPALYSQLSLTTFDVGLEYDGRNLKSKIPFGSYKSNYGIISYMQVGFPLLNGNKKAIKNKTSWAVTFGLKPITRINYKVQSSGRNSIDSTETLFEGTGGINQAFVGTAVKIKNFSIGINTGYLFGEKDYSTRLMFNNDTLDYKNADYETNTRFGGVFLNAGIQYEAKIKGGALRFGAYGNLKQQYHASKDDLAQTFYYDGDGATIRVDSIYEKSGQKGKIQLPATFGAGFSIEKEHFLLGADFETTQWNTYRFFGQKDLVKDSWTARAGIQYFPATIGSKGYFNYVRYRAGVSFGNDYINVDNDLPVYNITLGGAFPLKLRRSFYDLQYSVMNLAFEFGNRGNKNNNITENIYKFSVGFSLSDVWFRRVKYQ